VDEPLLYRWMEFPGLDDVFQSFNLRIGSEPRQVLVDVELEAKAEKHARRDRVDLGYCDGIDDLSAQPWELDERLLHALHYLRIGILRGEQLSHYAEPPATHPALIEGRKVAGRRVSLTGGGHLIRWIVTGDHVEDRYGVRHGPCQRAADVLI